MEMIFVTTAQTDEEAKELLRLLGMPFADIKRGGDQQWQRLSMKLKQQREREVLHPRLHPLPSVRPSALAYCASYGICRICFRELAYKGQIPGVRKASW